MGKKFVSRATFARISANFDASSIYRKKYYEMLGPDYYLWENATNKDGWMFPEHIADKLEALASPHWQTMLKIIEIRKAKDDI